MGFIASGSVVVAGAIWGLRLILSPGRFADGSGALVAVSIVLISAVAGLGLVLSRGRWARHLAFGILGAQAALAAFLDLSPFGWIGLAATGIAVVLVAGPWLDGFLRRLPPSDPPPLPAVILALLLLGVAGALGLAAPSGPPAIHWLAAAVSLATAWAFARAIPVGLWSARLVVPVLLIAAATQSPPAGLGLVLVIAVLVAGLAWSPQSARAVNPLVPRADGVAVPPELVPADLLAQAGYDDRGRPLPRKKP